MPRLAKGSKNCAVLIQFDDPVVGSVRHPHVLVRSNHQSIGITNARPLPYEIAFGIEDLYTLILPVADIYAAFLVNSNAVGQVKFTGPRAIFSPSLQEISVAVKLHDP